MGPSQSRERTHRILEAIIRTYSELGVPVGSEFLCHRHSFGVSSATIRSIMAELEEQGLITHPHTSAGRVPTDQGYRYYVDLLMEQDRIREEDERTIDRMGTDRSLGSLELLEEASRLLSEITQAAGVALVPQLAHGSFRHLELIPVGPQQVVAVLITTEGLVKHGRWNLPREAAPVDLDQLAALLNEEFEGMPLARIPAQLENRISPLDLSRMIPFFAEDPSVIVEGSRWVFEAPEFRDIERTRRLVRGLEERDDLAEILQRDLGADEVKLHIGSENRGTSLVDCSIVSAPYRLGGGVMGAIGVLGPTRMDYPRVTGLVLRIAERLTRRLEDE